MALLEEINVCVVCERPANGNVGGVPVYFCPEHFREHREDILAGAEWVAGLIVDERKRRRRRNRLLHSVGLPTMVTVNEAVLKVMMED